jgi:hypothetical protein
MSVYLAASLVSTCRRGDGSFLLLSFGFEKKSKKNPMILSAGRQAARGHIIWKFCLCATTFMPFHFLINILLLHVWIILAACPI